MESWRKNILHKFSFIWDFLQSAKSQDDVHACKYMH